MPLVIGRSARIRTEILGVKAQDA